MSLAAWALVVGAALVAAGAVVAMTGRCRAAFAVQGAGVAALAAGAIAVFAGSGAVGGAFRSSLAPAFGLDALSAFFLIVLCVVALPALAYARDALAPGPATAALAALTGAFILAMAGLVAARDIATFLACWELMTLLPAAAILVARQDAEVRRSVLVYLGVTHVAGAGVWVALLDPRRSWRDRRSAAGSGRPAELRRRRGADRVPHQGGHRAAARLAAAGAPGRSEPHLRADVGRDDHARALRADPGAVHVADGAPAVGRDHAGPARHGVRARRRPVRARPA